MRSPARYGAQGKRGRSGSMSNVVRWPKSRWAQAAIALIGAVVASICAFIWTNNTHFERYARQYPQDGQDGLAALNGAFYASGWTFIGVSIGLFVLQRIITYFGKLDSTETLPKFDFRTAAGGESQNWRASPVPLLLR